ncbi:MAG: hypothetical protein ACK5MN_10515 [Lachnospiraceae bacterium]
MTDQQKQAIRDMRQRDMSYAAIADTLGISQNTIKSFCRRENISANYDAGAQAGCKNCGGPLTHYPGAKPRTFCSDKCRYRWWNHQRKYINRKHNLTCFECGTGFESSNKHRKFCGRECYIRSRYGEGLP